MTLVDASTGEVVAGISAEDARTITDQIKVAVEGAWLLITRAYQSRAWAALGYSSWDDYCTREFGTARLKLPREERQEVVASLRDSGLSIRAIAAATGHDTKTVQKDLRQVSESPTPDPRVLDAHDRMREAMVANSRPKITGTDGKTYSPPKPTEKPRRSSLADAAQKAGWEFRKAVERIERIHDDDRFSANREQVAAHLRGHLSFAVEVCQDLLDAFDTEPQEAR